MGFDAAFGNLRAAVDQGRIPGGVLGVISPEGAQDIRTAGFAAVTPDRQSLHETTWFDLASLTKVIFTTERVLRHARAGDIDLDAPLVSVMPDLRQYESAAWERQVTFRQCLGHQTPFPAVEPIYTYGSDPDRLRAFVLQRAWQKGPPVYSDINFILLGIALERLAQRPLKEMDPGPGFSFCPPADQTAATEFCTWRGRVMRGEVHDENCFALRGSGHAGLFGTAQAVLGFATGLLARDRAGDPDVALLKAPLSETRTHGWQKAHRGWSGGDTCPADTIGHTGFTGTGLWIDFENRQAWALLTNRVHPSRHSDSGIAELRRTIGEALYARD